LGSGSPLASTRPMIRSASRIAEISGVVTITARSDPALRLELILAKEINL
jgi:hypothetical protein